MNVLKENKLAELPNPARLMLAAAYQLAGAADVAQMILAKVDEKAADPKAWEVSFGSDMRDDAILLDLYVQLGNKDRAWKAYERISQKLAGWSWHSTQSLAWALLAAGDYVGGIGLGSVDMKVEVAIPGEKPVTISTTDYAATVDLTAHLGKTITITSDSAKAIYVSIVQDFVPLEPPKEKSGDNLGLQAQFYDEDGSTIDPLRRGRVSRSGWYCG